MGFQENDHFYIEKKVVYTIVYTAEVRVGGLENEDEDDVECRGYEHLKNADWESVGVIERESNGFIIVDDENKPFKVEDHFKEILPDRCAVCSKKVVISNWKDRRIENDGLKCYDHLGTTDGEQKYELTELRGIVNASNEFRPKERRVCDVRECEDR